MDKPIVIIGGGITGVGTARDLSMRGFEVILVERSELGGETSTDFHGMLHSGARYAINDPVAAKKCWEENQVLKEIASDYIKETGGLFLKLEQDSDEYYQEKIEACKKCGIPIEEVSTRELQDKEPLISDNVDKCFRVPDGVIQPLALLEANLKDAKNRGVEVHEFTEVVGMEVEDGRIVRLDLESEGELEEVKPEIVVNATGPWAEKTGEMADLDVAVSPNKGVLTVLDNPGVEEVLNRCRPTDDGDIILPADDKVIVGTTSQEVDDPDDYEVDSSSEVLMIEQGQMMVDEISEKELIGSYRGLRPLYKVSEDEDEDERDITREFRVIDHESDGVENFITAIGGKWTIYRDMAESISDLVCDKLGMDEECLTGEFDLPRRSELDDRNRDWPPV